MLWKYILCYFNNKNCCLNNTTKQLLNIFFLSREPIVWIQMQDVGEESLFDPMLQGKFFFLNWRKQGMGLTHKYNKITTPPSKNPMGYKSQKDHHLKGITKDTWFNTLTTKWNLPKEIQSIKQVFLNNHCLIPHSNYINIYT